MAAIDIGSGAASQASAISAGYTLIDLTNPANGTGTLTSFEIYPGAATMTGTKMGTFSGSGTSYDDRDYETIGNVTTGSKQTFSGLNCDVTAGDFIGVFYSGGTLFRNTTSGAGVYYILEDTFGQGTHTYALSGTSLAISLYGTGETTSGWANIAKINGVASTSYSKVNAIAVASISKVNGIAV
jgi:hypothetical protein